MFLKYTKAKIQAVLHCLFHGVTLQHIRIFIFQKKKKIHYRLFEDAGEQSFEALPNQSPWPWSNDTPRKSLITLILNNRAGRRACLGGWALLGVLELQEKFPFLTLSKESSKNPICMASSKKSKIMTSHHLSFWILTKRPQSTYQY